MPGTPFQTACMQLEMYADGYGIRNWKFPLEELPEQKAIFPRISNLSREEATRQGRFGHAPDGQHVGPGPHVRAVLARGLIGF